MPLGKLRVGASCLVALSIAGFVHAAAPERGATALPAPAAPHEDRLSGRDIYERVLENRFASYIQESALISGDKAGNDQETRLRMWFKSFRDENGGPTEGDLLSKTLVKYTYPFELRHSGYLIINRLDRPNDQFVYLSSHRRVRRVNLRGEAVFGTDFSFEDVIPRELEHAAYQRLPDELLDGVPTFVVEAIPNSEMRS
ncbi:MAG: outer membrane lipoprotein-sorting protein, partial [Proteobacteria bacterium]|nr:outer membrane lipoprotein-sorting protein [Pseudomonadota bacterium]